MEISYKIMIYTIYIFVLELTLLSEKIQKI